MYYVYKVSFEKYNAVYIGCTNNIRRRKDQHNENARKEKSYFGRFLKSNGIILSESDFAIIGEFNDRAQALATEREETIALNGTGILVLNDIYSDHCSRVGMKGKKNPSSKTYVIVDMAEQTFETVEDMHDWCESHPGINYKNIIGTAKRKPHVCRNRYIAREISEWNNLSEHERSSLISGGWYAEHLTNRRMEHIERASKMYLVQTPEGNVIEVTNLDRYAHEHGINAGNLHASLTTGKSARGYKALERLT